jgi:hypothetical protein
MSHSQAINLFLQSADTLYGPMTTIRRNGQIEKKIPWSAFTLTEKDWDQVADARDILRDSNDIQELFHLNSSLRCGSCSLRLRSVTNRYS